MNGDDAVNLLNVKLLLETNKNCVTYLEGDVDFRSPECVAALKEADVVVSNPPFSLFREYIAQLIRYDKKFLIIGNMNAITYKEIFPLIMQNKIWLGYGFRGMLRFFRSPYEDMAVSSQHRDGMIRNSGVHWFTNLDVRKRYENILLFKRYEQEPELFPHYDNYDAIEVSKTAFISKDYFGVMGVPITFLDKYNHDQFEIVGNAGSYGVDGYSLCAALYLGGKKIFKRARIKHLRTYTGQYVTGGFSPDYKSFGSLSGTEREQILNYRLMIYMCEGNDKEKPEWFEVINTAGEKLTKQEARNAIYACSWLTDAKNYFSKPGCPAQTQYGKYLSGKAIRQDYLETALKWISDRDEL